MSKEVLSREECNAYGARVAAGLQQYKEAAEQLRNALFVANEMIGHYKEQRKNARRGLTTGVEARMYGERLDYDAQKTSYGLAKELLKRYR